MIYELTQRFYFEAAHTLRREVDTEPSKRIHGHTYIAKVTVSGSPNVESGMVIDLGLLRSKIQIVRDELDHRLLDEIAELGPPTLEGLCRYIWTRIALHGMPVTRVTVARDATGDSCSLQATKHT